MADTGARLSLRKVESVFNEMEEIRRQIMQRAYQLFCDRGYTNGRDVDDWLRAEREVTWSPAIEVIEKEDEYIVEAAVPGVDPKDLRLEVTSDDLLIKGNGGHTHEKGAGKGTVTLCEFLPGHLFRSVHFPRHVNPDKATAELKNGLLRVHVAVAESERAKNIQIRAS